MRRAPLCFLLLPTIISFPSYQRSERLARLERAMALLGECPPQHDGRAVRSSALYHEWADLKARFAAIIEPETPFDSASPDDWERVSMRYQRS